MRKLSYRAKLILIMTGLTGLMLLIFFIVLNENTEEQVNGAIDRTYRQIDVTYSQMLKIIQRDLQNLNKRLTGSNRIPALLQSAIEADETEFLYHETLYELKRINVPSSLVVFLDRNHREVLSMNNGKIPVTGRDLKQFDDSVFKDSEFAYQTYGSQVFMCMRTPLSLFDKTAGYFVIGIPVDNDLLRQLIDKGYTTIGFVSGDTILSSTIDFNDSITRNAIIECAVNSRKIIFRSEEQRWVAAAADLQEGGEIKRVIALNIETVLMPFEHLQKLLYILAFILMCLSITAGYWISNSLSKPIQTLSEAAEKVARGDYDFNVKLKHKDEFGHLAYAFNNMLKGLLMKERYRGLLDKVVSPQIAEEMLENTESLGGQKMEVTTMFTDIRGFTAMSEELTPENIVKILNSYFEITGRAIEKEGGVVDKYIGDAVMALFGVPVPGKEDVAGAVRASLEIINRMKLFNRNREAEFPEIKLGIGINRGTAVAGNLGTYSRMNYSVIGQSVNVASRLCSVAKPFQIIVSESVYREVSDSFNFRKVETPPLKGVKEKLNIYEVYET